MLNFQTLFEAVPGMYLVLQPDWTIVAASDAYLHMLECDRDRVLGRSLLEFYTAPQAGGPFQTEKNFQDNPAALGAVLETEGILRQSLELVQAQKVSHTIVPRPYPFSRSAPWKITHSPLLDEAGDITHLVHCVENLSSFFQGSIWISRIRSQRMRSASVERVSGFAG